MSDKHQFSLISKEEFKRIIQTSLIKNIISHPEQLAYIRNKIAQDDYEDNHDLYTFYAKDHDNYQIAILRMYLSILMHAKAEITAGDSHIYPTFAALREHAWKHNPYYTHFTQVMGFLTGIIKSEGKLNFPLAFSIPRN